MPDSLPLRPGDPAELGSHRLLGRLGEGGQGVVYLGRSASGEHVAIKLLHTRMAEDPGARDRFVRELSAAKKVARFCTAQVLDADVAGDRPYIVSEYVEGRSLRSHIAAEGPRGGGALERLAISTLTALVAIHKAGIVHRDFTPHNVLLGPDGPRVIDFGIARALGATRNEETNTVGTPSYMAPEQVTGGEIGPPADMFAWGSTIMFAGTGRPPFGNESVSAVMDRIIHADPDVSALPEPLRSVVTACLAKDPARRPTAEQAQARLLGHEATDSLTPPPAFGAAAAPAAQNPTAQSPTTQGSPIQGVATQGAATGPGFHDPATPELAATQSAAGPDFHRPVTPGLAATQNSAAPSPAGPRSLGSVFSGRRRPRAGWAILAGAAVVVAGTAVAIPLWPSGGDAATSPEARPAAAPQTPTPTPTPVMGEPQLNGVRSGSRKPVKPTKHAEQPPGCRAYDRAYGVSGIGTVLLKVSVCRGAYSGTTVLADTAPKDGWDVCAQLRGHVTGSGPAFVSTAILTSKDGGVRTFKNGPDIGFGPKNTRTEDWVIIHVGKCHGSGTAAKATWLSNQRLPAG